MSLGSGTINRLNSIDTSMDSKFLHFSEVS